MIEKRYFNYVLENKKIGFHNNSFSDELKVGQLSMFEPEWGGDEHHNRYYDDSLLFKLTLSHIPEVAITRTVQMADIILAIEHEEDFMLDKDYNEIRKILWGW